MAEKRGSSKLKPQRVFGHPSKQAATKLRVGLYARVSTHDHQTIPMQTRAMREYATRLLPHGFAEIRPFSVVCRLFFNSGTPESPVTQIDSVPAELRVYGGEALVAVGKRSIAVGRGKMIGHVKYEAPVPFDRKAFDSFHVWAGRRSFDLFLADKESRKQMNCSHLAMG
jgi:hypothetical protein